MGRPRDAWRRRAALPAVVALVFAFGSLTPVVARAATTTYTGPWVGGTILPTDTVVLADGASVTGNVVANGTLQFAQTGSLTIGTTLSGTGTLTLANTGTLTLAKQVVAYSTTLLDMTVRVPQGVLLAGTNAAYDLAMGVYRSSSMDIVGGVVRNARAFIASTPANYYELPSGKPVAVTVTGGTWASSGDIYLGSTGTGTLTVTGGLVSAASVRLASIFTGNWYGFPAGVVTVTGGTLAATGDISLAPSGFGVGRLSVGESGVVIVGGTLSRGTTGTITINPGGTLRIGSGGAAGVLGSPVMNTGTLEFDRSGTSSCAVAISGSGVLIKRGGGLLSLTAASPLTGTAVVQQGVLRLSHQSALGAGTLTALAGGTVTLGRQLHTTVGGLNPNAGGVIDVGDGAITVAGGLGTAALLAALGTGRGDGTWSGTAGIVSSVARADLARSVSRTVGWLDNGDGSQTFAYAAAGDSNLDWQVDILDAANFLANAKFDTSLPASWNEGDFGYDGIVDILDAADFQSSGLFDAGGYNAAASAAGVAAVPEPTMPSVIWLAAIVGGTAWRLWRIQRSRG
jgi:autotransporter-associated beta strand protein/T5SS/PEP-CTERM-associated repeat protein